MSAHSPAASGQIREDHWRRWYVGNGAQDYVCRFETIDGRAPAQLLTLPAWMFTAGMVGKPVGTWTGSVLAPVSEPRPKGGKK